MDDVVIIELQGKVSAANRLLKKAVEAKLEFSACNLIEFFYANDKELAMAALYNSANKLTAEDMEELYGVVDDDVIIEICSKYNITLPEYLREDEDEPWEDDDIYLDDEAYEKPKKLGFFGGLFTLLDAVGAFDNSSQQRHNGRCNGDCANCPPHYGYRHGRWYYGHDHVHGCEFGGNKGSGSMD